MKAKGKGKDNVWSVDNEAAPGRGGRRKGGGKTVRGRRKRMKEDGKVMVSGAMLLEVETILQTQVNMGYSSFLIIVLFIYYLFISHFF